MRSLLSPKLIEGHLKIQLMHNMTNATTGCILITVRIHMREYKSCVNHLRKVSQVVTGLCVLD